MRRHLAILLIAAAVVGLPFALRRDRPAAAAGPGDPELVIVSPHNEAIRREFGDAFSAWHRARYGRPVAVHWLAIGGTSEIARFLDAEYTAAVRAWWRRRGGAWPSGAAEAMLDRRFDATAPPPSARAPGESDAGFARREARERADWSAKAALHAAFRATDDPREFTSRIDLFFGGGVYDHARAHGEGLLVAPWPAGSEPGALFETPGGVALIPREVSGEIWRAPTFFGNAVSTFGICFNPDRLRDLGIERPPRAWADLAAPAYFRRIGVADPTKSGSIAKAFEMIVQQACRESVRRAGFDAAQEEAFESRLAKSPGAADVPPAYEAAVARGWADGINLIRRIGANARYFTESASKVPIDVSMGAAAAGLAIDFYARYQAQCSRRPDGRDAMIYVTPAGGSSVSADPISLLRGAEHRETAVRFIEFVLGEEGQRLWTYRPGEPGGPRTFALRRLPIRRDFYPSDDPAIQAAHAAHAPHAADDLAAPDIDAYRLGAAFVYRPRWTAALFGVQRDLVLAMCLDSQDELQAAWAAILRAGGPEANPGAMAHFDALPDRPEALAWSTAAAVAKRHDRIDLLREWTAFFRDRYRRAREAAEAAGPSAPAADGARPPYPGAEDGR
jgi:ABC-type Fe3+ transport system substrate-binding protein